MLQRSSILVVVVSSLTGIGLAGVAGAMGDEANPALHARGDRGAPAVGASSTGSRHGATVDDGEGDEPHSPGAASDNPYDDGAPPHASMAHVAVVLQDGMIRLPGGRFTMGSSNPHAPANERPSRALTLPAFWLDRTEVNVGGFRGCVDAHVCPRPARTSASCTYDAGDPELPVSCVRWQDADAYCRFAGKRLPTEAEWEYAARGQLAVPFPWGGAASCGNAVTLINDQSGKSCAPRPARVGAHPSGASVFGVQDMSGNVEEWTADWYSESVGAGPAPRAGAAHVLRGGGWLSPPSLSRTTARDWGSAVEAGPNVGFRCARDD
jgi:formylglycine-generating enzyme required for sulfatase activity